MAQLANRSTTSARTIGLRIPPTCPAVFIAALTTPELRPPISIHAAQLGRSVNIDEARATAIRSAATLESAVAAPASMARAASRFAPEPTAQRPGRKPNRRHRRAVVHPPPVVALPPT